MGRCQQTALAALTLLLALGSAYGQHSVSSSVVTVHGSQAGVSTSTSTSTQPEDWAVFGRNDPLGFFALLGGLDREAQKRYLNSTGAELQRKHHLACNVFGGEASCMPLSADSDFGRLCPNHDMKVDCAYYTDDRIEINEDPIARVQQSMASKGLSQLEAACPTCFSNQRALWCAQTVPKCGSYAAIIEEMLLPTLTRVTDAQLMGQSPVEALSGAVPELVKASSLSMPCREMCEAVVSSCSCSQEQKFGALLDAFMNSYLDLGMKLPPGFTTQLFGGVYDMPLCSLYGNSSDPRFRGTCDKTLATTCEDRTAWCGTPGKDNSAAQQVQELMAGQLANALFGWVDAPANDLFDDGRHIIDDADDKDQKELENKFLRRPGSEGGGSSSSAGTIARWTVSAVGVVVLVAAGGAFFVWRRRQRHIAEGYLAMTTTEEEAAMGQPMVLQPSSRHQSSDSA